MTIQVKIQYDNLMQRDVVILPPHDHYSPKEDIPGAMWNSTERYWRVPLTHRAVNALRKSLTGLKGSLDMSPEVRERLAKVADSPPDTDVYLNDDGTLRVVLERYAAFDDMLKALGASFRDNAYVLPAASLSDLEDYAASIGIELTLDAAVISNKQAQLSPPPGYDGTFLSLESVPLDTLDYVKERDTKALKSKAKKKPSRLSDSLDSIGLSSWGDLLNYAPIRYIDRSNPTTIDKMVIGEEATLVGTVTSVSDYDSMRKLVRITVADETGRTLSIAFFRQPWLAKQYRTGMNVIVYGKCDTYTNKNGAVFKQISGAKIDRLSSKRGDRPVIPVYSQSEKSGVKTWDILRMMEEALPRLQPPLQNVVGEEKREAYHLLDRHRAYVQLHFPENKEAAEAARRALAYEELLRLQLFINQRRKDQEESQGIVFDQGKSEGFISQYLDRLPYQLTGAQSRAVNDVVSDTARGIPMHRLLQGDVSSGKSTIAMVSILAAVANGYQGVLMAPTEILAEQLYLSIKRDADDQGFVSPMTGKPLSVEFLGNKTPPATKRKIGERAASGDVDVIVGTHALLYQNSGFANLGIVVIDEQHRFGTEQRTKLRGLRGDKITPHMLVMTATPIPRTSAMVLYGDLDVTVLDELPPGRVKIESQWVESSGESVVRGLSHPVWDKVRSEVEKGHQAYIVASLVEDNEKLAAASTEDTYDTLRQGALAGLRVGMVHGKQKRSDREEIMTAFAAGDIDVLVSTTVIEVGVNVPNATVMIVLDAGRFGISQLHQIRGRVGRATFPSVCYFVTDTQTSDGQERMKALIESTDGFYLAERDLEIRGEGTLFSTSQSGVSDLKMASLKNIKMLEIAAQDARALLTEDGDEARALLAEVAVLYREKNIDS